MIGAETVLPTLFGRIAAPGAVLAELRHPAAPAPVRAWADHHPAWLMAIPVGGPFPAELGDLGAGEREAIGLALRDQADLLLTDDRDAAREARRLGLVVVGTLGLLDRAAQRGLLDLAETFENLKATNFRYPPAVMEALLRRRRDG